MCTDQIQTLYHPLHLYMHVLLGRLKGLLGESTTLIPKPNSLSHGLSHSHRTGVADLARTTLLAVQSVWYRDLLS